MERVTANFMMEQQDIVGPDEDSQQPVLAIREIAEKARFGGLYYFLGLVAGGLLTPNFHFRSVPVALLVAAFTIPLLLREYAYQLSKKEDLAAWQRTLKIFEFGYFINALAWAAFTIYLLSVSRTLGEGAAATLIACAGITAGGVTSIIPHNRLIKWYCFLMLVIPGLCVPLLIQGSVRWYVSFIYFLYYYYMLRFGRVQSGAYWQARSRNIALQRYAAELEVAREQALAGSKAKSDFLAKMSHEIRTPMNGVVGIAQLLENTALDAQQKKYVHIIRESGSTLLHIIDDILDFSKLEADKMSLHPLPFDLPQLAADLYELFSLQLDEKPVRIITRHSDELPTWVLADPVRIRQILYNLIGNAIKFTSQGEIIIDLEFRPAREAEAARVKFSVTDSGIGIPKDLQSLVFTQFEQFTMQSSAKGTGLGLAICKRLVEIMGGTIGFQSTRDVGSCFWFEIPVTVVDATLVDATLSSTHTHAADQFVAALPSGLAVLVVEDDPVNQLVIQHQLEYLGNHVLVIDNGEMAIPAIQQQTFDLIFMDYNLPDMSGLAVTEIIRQWEHEHEKKRTPIIALTAHAQNEIKQSCFAAGMDGYLTKPVIATELRHIIARWATAAN